MKKQYETAELEIILLDDDIITGTSTIPTETEDGDINLPDV